MRKTITGQVFLIICCIFYLIWWYRGYRLGVIVKRAGGVNGILLMITTAFGIAGVTFSLQGLSMTGTPKINPPVIAVGGIVFYIAALLITKVLFHRIVTSELFLIVGWTMLEVTVINRLNAAGLLSDGNFALMGVIIAAACIISLILYVAYYQMEEMKAFYAAMIPLITEAAAMAILVGIVFPEVTT